MRRDQQVVTAWAILVLIGLIAHLVWNQYVYDDWRCAFSNCVKVKQ